MDSLRPHIVRISTPRGSGTGFLLARGRNRSFVAIATAAHVVDHAHYWEQPIRVDHVSSGKSVLLRVDERVVFLDTGRDSAAILFDKGDFPFPEEIVPLGPQGMTLREGNEIGWLGFPAVSSQDLCFFSGRVSAYREAEKAYLVDGVAINGVSGGPAIHPETSGPVIMGVLAAYIPNRATGEVLPGLAMVTDVSHLHELAPTFASLDEAKEQETPPVAPAPPPISPPTDPGPTSR